jgi:hypothetical protein
MSRRFKITDNRAISQAVPELTAIQLAVVYCMESENWRGFTDWVVANSSDPEEDGPDVRTAIAINLHKGLETLQMVERTAPTLLSLIKKGTLKDAR